MTKRSDGLTPYDLANCVELAGADESVRMTHGLVERGEVRGRTLSSMMLSVCYLNDLVFVDCQFSNNKWRECQLRRCEFIRCGFYNSQFLELDLESCGLHSVTFDACWHMETWFNRCELDDVAFRETKAESVSFIECALGDLSASNTIIERQGKVIPRAGEEIDPKVSEVLRTLGAAC